MYKLICLRSIVDGTPRSTGRTVMGIDSSIGTDRGDAVLSLARTVHGTLQSPPPPKAEITDTADIPQFNSHRIMRYVLPAIAEIYRDRVGEVIDLGFL